VEVFREKKFEVEVEIFAEIPSGSGSFWKVDVLGTVYAYAICIYGWIGRSYPGLEPSSDIIHFL
jgi:hypothetical protein